MSKKKVHSITISIFLGANDINTIKGGSRCAEKSCKVLMMMKAAKLGWAGAGPRAGPGRAEAGQDSSRAEVGTGQEQGRSR